MFTDEEKIAEFILYCAVSKNLSDKTVKAYRSDLGNFSRFENDTGLGLREYLTMLYKTGHKSATIKRHAASLSQYFAYVYKHDRKNNPMNDLDMKIKLERSLPKTIPLYDMRKLFSYLYRLKACAASEFGRFQITRDLALLDLIASTGIRIGEAAAIRLDDLDMRSRIVLIHGKGRKERLLYLSCSETLDNLREWLSVRKKLRPDNDYLFVNRHLCKLSEHGIEDIFKKYRDGAKIASSSTPHYLRHTFATNLLANGSDLRSVQELLGHSNISVTERYTEVTTSRKIKVMKRYNYRNNLLGLSTR